MDHDTKNHEIWIQNSMILNNLSLDHTRYEEMILDQIRLRGSPASCVSLDDTAAPISQLLLPNAFIDTVNLYPFYLSVYSFCLMIIMSVNDTAAIW